MAVFGTAVFGTAVFGPGGADTTAPTVPGGLTATAINATRINLGWIASTDAVGVTGYVIRRGGSILTTVGAVTSYADTTVSPSTTYSYTVDAFDAAGNHSAQSSSASATTPATADTTSPSVPNGLAATAPIPYRINLTWNPSTDNVAVAGYTIYRGGSLLTTVASPGYSDLSVTPSNTYSYTVDAYDAAGNHSAQSLSASATTPAAPVGPGFAPSVTPASPRLGPITSSLGTVYTSGQVTAMLFSPSLQVEWRWDLLDSQMNYKLDLTPLLASDHAPTISNDSTRAVKRQIEGLVMRADSRVNYFQDLIRPHFRLQSPDGGWLDWPRGIFMMTPPNREINEAVTWWTMVAPDLTQLLADASFDAAYSVSAGTGYTEAIATLLATYGGFTTLGYRAIASTTRLPVPSNWDAGTNYLKAINDLLAAISYVPAAMDGNLLVSEPQPDYTVQPADIILDAVNGPSIIIGPFTEQTDYSNAYNIVRVAGTDPRRQPVFGFYRNTRSDSPVSLFRWHPRTKVIQDSNLATDQAAQQRAITEAQSAARIFATFRIGLPPFPFFEDLDIVDLTYKSADDGLVSQSYLALHWAHPCTINQPTIVDLQRVVSF